jgi:hypothetical protein
MKEIRDVIRVLAKHNFRSISNVVGEYVERLITKKLNGVQANHCQRGFDLTCQGLGKIEVKSRNSEARSLRCTLPPHKWKVINNFILVIVTHGEIEKVLLFSGDKLKSLKSNKSDFVYIDRRNFGEAEDITEMFDPNPL